ncbi:hypothetical protein [Xanthomonas sacchari]|uniref:hypothetical protein n=1 Tax=Xanthomonas sacchari TaxID=56458 RepID=UPI0012E07D02|nr:hypothetical protein [Xanthomonas sacchari]
MIAWDPKTGEDHEHPTTAAGVAAGPGRLRQFLQGDRQYGAGRRSTPALGQIYCVPPGPRNRPARRLRRGRFRIQRQTDPAVDRLERDMAKPGADGVVPIGVG